MIHLPEAVLRPIEQWPGRLTPDSERRSSYQFRATPASNRNLLAHELRMLDARNAVLQLAISETDLRRDGGLRARSRPEHPGIILAFDTPAVGPLQFACDTYDTPEANLRAVALTLQALRAVERYGATKTGEQYRGWQQLPPPVDPAEQMTVEQAARFIAEQAGEPGRWESVLESRAFAASSYRIAARRLHPDAGDSSEELFKRLQAARRILDQEGYRR